MPNKSQLAVIAAARITELLSERSQATYMFYQLQSFAPQGEASDGQVVSQAGILMASWAAAQSIMAVWWGRAADSPRLGRKSVLLIGLSGTAISGLGTGFAQSFNQVLLLKVLAGGLNTNMGIFRTMIGETTEPRFESRAFLLLPMCFSIGEVLGPLLGGFLADPSTSSDSNVFAWMARFPFVLPNLICALFILISALIITLWLDETHPSLRWSGQDQGRKIGRWITKRLCSIFSKDKRYERLPARDEEELAAYPKAYEASGNSMDSRLSSDSTSSSVTPVDTQPTLQSQDNTKLPRLLNWRVAITLLTHFILVLHISAFNTSILSFLSAQRAEASQTVFSLHLAGGVGLSLYKVGLAVALLGFIGLSTQVLIYPFVTTKLGSFTSYKTCLPLAGLGYFFLPFMIILPNDSWMLWLVLFLLLGSHALSRTFAQPGMIILVNKCAPDPRLCATIHGMALSIGSMARILGPFGSGWALKLGLENNMVGVVWWCMAFAVGVNWILLSTLPALDSS
ncbi:hypothetical protein FOC1_g10000667 [Fusarium oxysporum f. sp. cubense race 1]|uniref:Major facilitator superfamily (MFS) profile domain-containing protein n=2 Tax=Fusarium oxysporum TaxID=5507 RepID=N4U8H8_FUSC1|nr:hypothetical protein FOC1_g10000667 [Fusarium oxysporum f. sp. cubense race 1]